MYTLPALSLACAKKENARGLEEAADREDKMRGGEEGVGGRARTDFPQFPARNGGGHILLCLKTRAKGSHDGSEAHERTRSGVGGNTRERWTERAVDRESGGSYAAAYTLSPNPEP
jgi:hypothetical protein